MIEMIAASRCPRCEAVVAPPARYCPWHPVPMTPTEVPGIGEVVSFTTLHSPPVGFKSPLHIAIVELDGGARFVCHGAKTEGLKIGSTVARASGRTTPQRLFRSSRSCDARRSRSAPSAPVRRRTDAPASPHDEVVPARDAGGRGNSTGACCRRPGKADASAARAISTEPTGMPSSG